MIPSSSRPDARLDYLDQVRLVPMTGQQRDWAFKAASVLDAHEELGSIGNAWDAAPADPAEAVRQALADWYTQARRREGKGPASLAVLAALGFAGEATP